MTVETTTITADPWKRLDQNGYEVLDLAVAIEALRNNEHYLRTGHHALNLWKNTLLQALLIALGGGGTLAEHAAPGAATIHILDGEVRVTIADEVIYLKAGEMMTLSDMTRHAVMKHIDVLRKASLINTAKDGRKRENSLNPVPIRQIYERWMGPFAELWSSTLLRVKDDVEKKK